MTPVRPPTLLGQSLALQRLRERLRHAADSRQEVLLTGEPGAGKRLAAQLIHQAGPRRDRPLIRLRRDTLAAFLREIHRHLSEQPPEDRQMSRPGTWISTVQGSTLLLEDVGEWSKEEQRLLTGILRCRTQERFGGIQDLELDIQLIATTRTDLEPAVRAGRFWADLYYRLHGFPVAVPPLRDHREDLPLLACEFLAQIGEQTRQVPRRLSPVALELLLCHHWPGNVRELRHCLEQAAALATEGQIEPRHLWAQANQAPNP
jgi:formate hydrogenlyase transcriptional activator